MTQNHSEQQAQSVVSLEDAEIGARLAKQGFTDLTKASGGDRRPAHILFCKRVSRWSNCFTDKRLRRFAYTLGRAMQGDTHSGYITYKKLARNYLRDHGRSISRRQLYRYVTTLQAAGILTCWSGKQDETMPNPGMQAANVYVIEFWRVLKMGVTETHDFLADVPESENVPQHVPQDGSQHVPQDGSPTVPVCSDPVPSSCLSPTPGNAGVGPEAKDTDKSDPDSGEAPGEESYRLVSAAFPEWNISASLWIPKVDRICLGTDFTAEDIRNAVMFWAWERFPLKGFRTPRNCDTPAGYLLTGDILKRLVIESRSYGEAAEAEEAAEAAEAEKTRIALEEADELAKIKKAEAVALTAEYERYIIEHTAEYARLWGDRGPAEALEIAKSEISRKNWGPNGLRDTVTMMRGDILRDRNSNSGAKAAELTSGSVCMG